MMDQGPACGDQSFASLVEQKLESRLRRFKNMDMGSKKCPCLHGVTSFIQSISVYNIRN